MEFTVTRNKNLINFLAEGKEQPYVFDINTGILYSLKSKPLKNFPSGLKACINDNSKFDFVLYVMALMLDRNYNFKEDWGWKLADYQACASLLSTADKMNSLSYKPARNDYWQIDKRSLTVIGDNFKDFVEYLTNCENDESEPSVQSFMYEYYPAIWARKNGIEINEVITPDVVREIMRYNFNAEQTEYLIKTFRRGIPYFFMTDNGQIRMYDYLSTFQRYMRYCEELEIKYDKDFFRGVALANRAYQTHKAEIDNKKIVEHLSKHNFNFEDDKFTVVVPQTSNDFKTEAFHQNNCVYNLYLPKVVEGRTNVVFIRKKSNPTKPYITCEVTRNGNIYQYLLANNNSVKKDTDEYAFKLAFQNWLNETWE